MPSAYCLCETFEITVNSSFGEVRYCHCLQCRRKSGTAFTANARIDKANFTLRGPKELITEFEHKPGLFNAFCAKCGSPLFARSTDKPNDIRVRLGGFEGELDVAITGHVWVDSKSSWYRIEDPLPQYQQKINY